MIRKLNKIFIIIFIMYFICCVKSYASDSILNQKYTEVQIKKQRAIQEVADAYYNKGINAQYCTWRKSFFYSPEEATSQHMIYSVCSDFIYSVYYQAFGMKLPYLTNCMIAYG